MLTGGSNHRGGQLRQTDWLQDTYISSPVPFRRPSSAGLRDMSIFLNVPWGERKMGESKKDILWSFLFLRNVIEAKRTYAEDTNMIEIRKLRFLQKSLNE